MSQQFTIALTQDTCVFKEENIYFSTGLCKQCEETFLSTIHSH